MSLLAWSYLVILPVSIPNNVLLAGVVLGQDIHLLGVITGASCRGEHPR